MANRQRRRAPNDGGTIDQRPSGRWRLRVRIDDRQVAYGTYETEDEAVRAQARWRVTHLLPADDPELIPAVPDSVMVGGVRCDEWFERWQQAKAARSPMVRLGPRRGGAESTSARDWAQWRPWWSPAIGDRLPHTLDPEDIADVLRKMELAGRAPNTIRTHWLMIGALFNWLVSEGVLGDSPVAGLHLTVDPAHDRVREIVVPDFRFLDVLTDRLPTPEDRLIFELLLGTGGRRSEVAGIRVGDIDLGASRVWIRQPVVEVEGRLVRQAKPKGGYERAVIVGPRLAALLMDHLIARGIAADDEPLFKGSRGEGLRWNNYMARRFRPAVESAAIRWAVGERRQLMDKGWTRTDATAWVAAEANRLRRLTPHHLRHTAAALLWAAGASDIEVQMILGHGDVATSKRLYAHLLTGAAENAAARVEQLREARRGEANTVASRPRWSQTESG
jgi:integrase